VSNIREWYFDLITYTPVVCVAFAVRRRTNRNNPWFTRSISCDSLRPYRNVILSLKDIQLETKSIPCNSLSRIVSLAARLLPVHTPFCLVWIFPVKQLCWLIFFCRLIIVISIGDSIYGDEQSNFICNTLQPGCSNVCYNQFAPISQIRCVCVGKWIAW